MAKRNKEFKNMNDRELHAELDRAERLLGMARSLYVRYEDKSPNKLEMAGIITTLQSAKEELWDLLLHPKKDSG